ncbi:hypothetical protein IVA80_15340 [Bradyrhizobium sp. 139]|uniref:DUF7220 family protein n=1 Tax=Bradyrhizobium sp. 139 TaxID=2782616 RepID=UPI001FFB5C1C|nr:hypothetical protein [Bradyrhizobium sp. 139]MCK1742198.1 hypothetical protein [Bradyrhizobium sp. 139]
MKQTRRASLIETILNTAIGYLIAVTTQIIVLPWFGVHLPIASNFVIGLVFTVVSIARGFALRRFFEALRVKGVLA